ncbi:Rqc2 family fibronectin-binding protein [Tannockella kyphosi]|uniref:Rqc2 family fibronectin-binding protein n=1 Tax=Tannockella kyphosi TaxID=2899121 RepID=UPI0020115A4B|nr:NFACT RNA binding domain-containing protein [Tannockella kyphosi]
MANDGIVMHQTIDALKEKIETGRINKIYQISKYELLIHVRSNRENFKLLLSSHPMHARLHLTNMQYPTPEQPNTLTMLFRKYLEGGYIQKIEQVLTDRICHLTFLCHNELGDIVHYHMYIEIMGKHSNIILCNEDKKIIDCIKRISPSMNTTRFLQPGAMYQYPPMDDTKLNPYTSSYQEHNNLTKVYLGFSPLLSKEVLYRIDQGQYFEDIIKEIKDSRSIYISKVDDKEYFHILPLTHLQVEPTQLSIFDGFDTFFFAIDQKERIKQQTSNLSRFINNEYQKNVLKLEKLEDTLHISSNREEYRIYGDLLFSYLGMVQKGMWQVEVFNYYDNTNIMIELDPKLDGKENAKKYYNKYQKAKNSITVLNEQIEKTKIEIEYFDGLISLLNNANYYDALEIKDELESLGYLKKKTKKAKKPTKPRVETYFTKDNIEILIGKNNLQNDYLTFKSANRYDTWFHAQGMPGSHVVVKGQDLDEYTIRLASTIAAYFSKGKVSSSVPVSYTLVKNLKKPSGAKPGKVIVEAYKTIYIDPDDSWIKELTKK